MHKTIINKVKKVIHHPELIFKKIMASRLLPDRIVLKCYYRYKTGKKLNLKNPVLYNEKLQWIKLYDRHSEYSDMIDKYEVRKYIAQTIGDDYLIPLFGVWNSFDDIPFNTLPNQFVLKCTHDSGGIVICKDKQSIDLNSTRSFFIKRLSKNYYRTPNREWAYKNIRPRIIAEKLMVDESKNELKDYKIYCFNGKPQIVQVDFDRFIDHKRNFYSLDWKYQPFSLKYPTAPDITINKPQNFLLMLDLAKKLSYEKMHVRVDLYAIENKIFFGELTFYHGGGYEIFYPPEWEKIFGDWLTLPEY